MLSIVITLSVNIINENYRVKIFEQYDFDINESVAIHEIQKQMKCNIVIAILGVIFSVMIYCVFYFKTIKKEEENLSKLIENIKNICNKERYQFLIEEGDKSYWGAFQNEIYQTTIRLQEYSKEIEKDRDKLSIYLSDISHQLRTPLLSVTIAVDNLLENMNEFPEEERKMIYDISIQLDKMKWLVENLLKMAQLDTKCVALKKEKIHMQELIRAVEKNVEILLEIRNQKLKIKKEEDITFVGDFRWNVEALTNIVKNAIEYSNEGDVIQIEYIQNPLYTEITIEDHGRGIGEDDLMHIFDRFYKGKNSDKDSFGIGLSLAKQIIIGQDGEIKVQSKIGKGTKFIVKFVN